MQTVNERVQCIVNEMYNGNVSEFERASQIKPYTVKNIIGGRKTKPSFDVLESIIRNNVQISSDWLLTGKGRMIKQLYPGETLIKDEYESSIVYHYTNIDSFVSILSDLRLKCSIINKSNDYKEKESLKEMLFHNRSFNNNLRYLSFCSGPLGYRNPVLWHHYANAHKGVCIGIDITNLDKDIIKGDVIYERNINNDKYSQVEYMMRKTPEWMGELEYRLLFPDGRDFFDIKDCLCSVCFGRDVSDEEIIVLKEIIPAKAKMYKIDKSSNGYMGRHELPVDNEAVLSGSRESLNPLEENVVAKIRNKLFAHGKIEKRSSETVSEGNSSSSPDQSINEAIISLRAENAVLREMIGLKRKDDHSSDTKSA